MKWFFMLSKRLYKKPVFVILLVLIPICVLFFSLAAKEDSGFLNIALVSEGDGLSHKITQELIEEESVINFTLYENKDEAIRLLEGGKTDEVWIFPQNTEKLLEGFIESKAQHVVKIVTGEESVALRLSREKLSAVMYKYCARAYYIDYIRANIPELDGFSEESLIEYFNNVSVDEELFVYADPIESTGIKTNYLTSPIRGLSGVLMLVSAMAATVFFMEDEKNGVFAFVKYRRKNFVAFGCVLTAVINVSLALLLSLLISSLAGNIFKELFILFAYGLLCTSFAILLKEVLLSIRVYSAVLPAVAVLCIGVCPVFFDFRGFLQLLLPPTYYVNALYNGKYFIYMLAYIAVCLILIFIIEKLKSIKAR